MIKIIIVIILHLCYLLLKLLNSSFQTKSVTTERDGFIFQHGLLHKECISWVSWGQQSHASAEIGMDYDVLSLWFSTLTWRLPRKKQYSSESVSDSQASQCQCSTSYLVTILSGRETTYSLVPAPELLMTLHSTALVKTLHITRSDWNVHSSITARNIHIIPLWLPPHLSAVLKLNDSLHSGEITTLVKH